MAPLALSSPSAGDSPCIASRPASLSQSIHRQSFSYFRSPPFAPHVKLSYTVPRSFLQEQSTPSPVRNGSNGARLPDALLGGEEAMSSSHQQASDESRELGDIARKEDEDRTRICGDARHGGEGKSVQVSSYDDPEAERLVSGEQEESESNDRNRMSRVCDKLIDVFMVEKTKPEDWRKLIAFSKEWANIRPHFFERCKSRAQQETDLQRKGNLLKLARKMKEVDDDIERHNELLAYIKEHQENVDTVVARRRKDFTTDFFEHVGLLFQANYNNVDEQHGLACIVEKCSIAVEAYDKAAEDDVALSSAQMKLDDILSSASLDAACCKIDELAKRNELDSTLMLLITKAWAASKESNMMKEEVKDILHHLYMVARGNMQRLVPKEVRIMRHILSLEDPKEVFAALTEAFSPGVELEGKDIDLLYTTPQALYDWINIVLDAYYHNKRGNLMQSVLRLMNPEIICQLEALKRLIADQFL